MKKIVVAIISILVIGFGIFGVYSIFFKQDKDTTLTLIDKQWIENNKNQLIDLNIPTNIPIYNYSGNGVIFEFINELEEKTGLEFNKIPYNIENEPTSEYAFIITSEIADNQLLIYEDNYALISDLQIKYNDLFSIDELTVGVLDDDFDKINYYLRENKNIKYISYEDITSLLKAYDDEKINAIILPRTFYLNQIFDNQMHINYIITELKSNLVLQLGNNERLNSIIEKYFNKWYLESYNKSYGKNLTNYYFYKNDVDDDSKVAFTSKQYKYGFIDYAPFDKVIKNSLIGINNNIITEFASISGIEVKNYEYSSLEEMINNFNENKIDFYFNLSSIDSYDMDVKKTISGFDEKVVVLSHVNNKQTINSIYSLKNKKVMTIKNSKIANELINKEIEIKEFNTLNNMLNSLDESYLIVIDKEVYDTYKTTSLKDYTDIYTYTLDDDYNFIIRDINDNKVLANFFDFYLSFIDTNNYINKINYKMFHLNDKFKIGSYIIITICLIIIIGGSLILGKNRKKQMKKAASGVSKENRIKYIDLLTSLKNRNYLNDSIEKWDECGIYPQAIIIVDLNNIAYINDNYGHAEGDNVIKEAASILFNNQIENSEIMRTNGNEFLIYLVEYNEKQVVTYIRKLNKDLKELSHGFGAAIGYSMINDGLKTIDDAINEATLDMKTNKEEAR